MSCGDNKHFMILSGNATYALFEKLLSTHTLKNDIVIFLIRGGGGVDMFSEKWVGLTFQLGDSGWLSITTNYALCIQFFETIFI